MPWDEDRKSCHLVILGKPTQDIYHIISLHGVVTLLGFYWRCVVHLSSDIPSLYSQLIQRFLYVPWPGSNPLPGPFRIVSQEC
jgi:hypothetical protein